MLGRYRMEIAIAIVVSLVIAWQYLQISTLKADLGQSEGKRAIAEANTASLRMALEKQKAEVKILQMDRAESIAKYEALKKQSEKVRYRAVYNTVPNIGVQSDECKDIKDLIDNIRSVGY